MPKFLADDFESCINLLHEIVNRDDCGPRQGAKLALKSLEADTTRSSEIQGKYTDFTDLELTCDLVNQLVDISSKIFDGELHRDLTVAIKESCKWLKVHFQAHPTDRQRYSDFIQVRVPESFPWEVVRPEAKGLALLYNFSPFQDTGATVASKRIRDFSESIDVIACSFLHKKKMDRSVEKIAEPYIKNRHFLNLIPSWASWEPYRAFIAKSNNLADALISEGASYEFVYSRAMWAPSIYSGAEFKFRHPNIKWIAEFSDPLSLDVEGRARGGEIPLDSTSLRFIEAIENRYGDLPESRKTIFGLAEILAYAFADEIIFTNEHQKSTMMSHIENSTLRERVQRVSTVSHHPSLPPEYYEVMSSEYSVDDKKLNLGYFGEFYSSRSITEVTSAIRSLPPSLRDKVNLHVFTNYIPNSSGRSRPRQFSKIQFDELVSRALQGVGAEGIESLVFLNPSLPYLEFLATTNMLDYLIVNDAQSGEHHSLNPYLPSKWSDYKGSNAKTWAFIEDGSILSQQGIANTTPVGDSLVAREVLWEMISHKFPDRTSQEFS